LRPVDRLSQTASGLLVLSRLDAGETQVDWDGSRATDSDAASGPESKVVARGAIDVPANTPGMTLKG